MRIADSSSLGSLSRQFLEVIEATQDGIVDLNDIAERLQVPKRRVYDVTNVLEGVDLLEKISKNYVRWKQPLQREEEHRIQLEKEQHGLENKLKNLQELEIGIEQEIKTVYGKLEELVSNPQSKEALYITKEQLRRVPSLETERVFALKIPEDVSVYRTVFSRNHLQSCTRFMAESSTEKIEFLDAGLNSAKSSDMDESSKENNSRE